MKLVLYIHKVANSANLPNTLKKFLKFLFEFLF